MPESRSDGPLLPHLNKVPDTQGPLHKRAPENPANQVGNLRAGLVHAGNLEPVEPKLRRSLDDELRQHFSLGARREDGVQVQVGGSEAEPVVDLGGSCELQSADGGRRTFWR